MLEVLDRLAGARRIGIPLRRRLPLPWRRRGAALLEIPGEALDRLAGVVPVDVADRHDVLAGDVGHVAVAHAANTHAGDVQEVRRRGVAAAEHAPRHDPDARAGYRRSLDEVPPGNALVLLVHDAPFSRGGHDIPSGHDTDTDPAGFGRVGRASGAGRRAVEIAVRWQEPRRLAHFQIG